MLIVTEEQRSELGKCSASRTLPAGDVFRARLILALADGQTYGEIMALVADNGTDDLSMEATLRRTRHTARAVIKLTDFARALRKTPVLVEAELGELHRAGVAGPPALHN